MNNIFILDGQNDNVIGHINKKYVIDNEHEKDLPTHKDYFSFTVLADNKHAEHLTKRNGLIIPGEDGELLEFRIFESIKYRNAEGLFIEVHALATYLDLKNQKIFDPHKTNSETALQHANLALAGTEWQVGEIDFKGTRTLTFDNPFNSYDYILRIAREFELEPRFYIETDGNEITGRYVDLIERIGEFRGRTIEFGRDLQSIERKEDTSEVVTALWVYGPEREDGTRLKVFVEDDEARQRWGRRGQHIIDYYEPQTENQDITEERLRTLGEMELRKRINAVVTYEAEILDLENVPGLENKKIRFGDTIRIKDTKFNPPLYLEARVFNVKRDVFNKAKKTVQLGDYREYTEEEVKELFRQMQEEIRRRLERLVLVSIISSAGNVFKNGEGSTELTAKTFLGGAEVDEDGTKYEYRWHKFDKNGDYVPGFYKEGKTITVNASDIDEKATFRVEIILDGEVLTVHEITLTNVFDGEDGEQGPPGPKGEDGKTFYTWIKYADTPTSGMSDNPEGKEYIGIAYNKETPTPSTNYDDYIWAKFKGEQGIPGPPGEDGQPTYTWVKYADDEHGNGMSDSPDGKLYIGLAFNKTTPEESNNPADYTWSLMPQNIEIGGRNLIIRSTEEKGTWINLSGQVVSANNHSTSDYIPVKPNTDYMFTKSDSNLANDAGFFRWAWYDEDKNYISRQANSSNEFLWTTPNNVHYVRISYPDDSYPKFEKGNKATDWTPAPEDVQEQIDEAKQEAEEAKQTAQQAQTTADGKNSVFTQPTAPPTTGRKIGDVWFDTSRDNLMHRFDGTQWIEAKWGEQSIVANSITANHIKSLVGLNVNDQFIVDSNGNVKFAGHLEGASGTFGEVTAIDGDFFFQDANSQTKYGIITKTNLITDHSFELAIVTGNATPDGYFTSWDSHTWGKVGTPRLFSGYATDTALRFMFGFNYMGVNNSNYIRTSMTGATLIEGRTYTFSSHFMNYTGSPTPKLRIKLMETDLLTDQTTTLQTWEQTFPALTNGSKIVRHSITFTLTEELGFVGDYYRWVEFEILSGNSSWLYVDGVQLVEGDYPTVYEEESSLWMILNGLERVKSLEARYLYSHGNIRAGGTSGYINLRPGNEHGFIEFYRTEGRAAYIGIPSAGSEYFDINADGLSGEIRLRGRNVLIEQRLISPQTYNVTVQNPANVFVTSNGYFARSTSSKRYKADIQYNDIDYRKILKLQQASWVDRKEFENNDMSAEGLKRYYGAIAEDFEKIGLSEFVVYNEETGEVENFSDRAWVLLIPNINDILEELEQIKERLERLENEGSV